MFSKMSYHNEHTSSAGSRNYLLYDAKSQLQLCDTGCPSVIPYNEALVVIL
jgi:hypothetical protein